MKKFVLTLCIIAGALVATAAGPQKEVGVSFRNLNSFGLQYKSGNHQYMWRFNALFGEATRRIEGLDADKVVKGNYSFGGAVGLEFTRPISEGFDFRYGLDLFVNQQRQALTYTNTVMREVTQQTIINNRGLNLVLGLSFLMSERLVVGFEVLPALSYANAIAKDNTSSVKPKDPETLYSLWQFGFNTNGLRLTLGFRF